MLEQRGMGIKTAVAHQLCPHEGGTQDVFENWIFIMAQFGVKHGIAAGMCVCL